MSIVQRFDKQFMPSMRSAQAESLGGWIGGLPPIKNES